MQTRLPLSDWTVTVQDWPAARAAGALLALLGARTQAAATGHCADLALCSGTRRVIAMPTTLDEDLLASGIAELSGRVDGPPLAPVGKPATVARAAGLAMALTTGVSLDTAPLLGQRAKLLGLRRNGPVSAGGAARLIAAADGWFALNLPRPSDLEMLPALIEGGTQGDDWAAVAEWARARPLDTVVDRAVLLNLAVGAVPDPARTAVAGSPWKIKAWPVRRAPAKRPPRVVNLGALWAGPLCAQLLRRCGMQVTDVQSVHRPEQGPEPFYSALHAEHSLVRCDFRTAEGRERLAGLLHDADVVIEASTPRALRALGVPAEVIMQDGRPRAWVQITGHGQDSGRIAFGDDAAAAGGLLAWDREGPVFAADAIADPLTGMLAATAASACIAAGGAWTVDIAMSAVARYASAA